MLLTITNIRADAYKIQTFREAAEIREALKAFKYLNPKLDILGDAEGIFVLYDVDVEIPSLVGYFVLISPDQV